VRLRVFLCPSSQRDGEHLRTPRPDDAHTGVYGPPLCRKRKMKVTGWSAQMYSAVVGARTPGLDGMRCALVLFSDAALEGFSCLQVSRAPGSTVVSSHSSPADLAQNHQLRSSRWSVDVGIANAISKPGLSQASSAGQSCCSCTDQHWGPIGFVLSEHSPGHMRHLIRFRSLFGRGKMKARGSATTFLTSQRNREPHGVVRHALSLSRPPHV
jgi:hypothetical protein